MKKERYSCTIPVIVGRIARPVKMHTGIASAAEFLGDEFIIVARDSKALRKAWRRVFLDLPMTTNKTRRVIVTMKGHVTP